MPVQQQDIMSNDKGIFEPQEGFAAPPKSPFAASDAPTSPFGTAESPTPPQSPFAVAGSGHPSPPASPFGTVESKPAASPFGTAEPKSSASPFAPAQEAPAASPFGTAPKSEPAASPFGKSPVEESPKPAAASPFGHPVVEAKKEEAPAPAPKAEPTPAPAPAPAQQPEPARQAAPSYDPGPSESSGIRQLELRAIFGVDRELNESEILQRSRSLPGIRQLARVPAGDMGAIEGIKRVLSSIGFGDGQVKLYCGSSPVEFVREGNVLLAVQTDGGFAPGVRETIMIVARELSRMS